MTKDKTREHCEQEQRVQVAVDLGVSERISAVSMPKFDGYLVFLDSRCARVNMFTE